MKIKRTYKETSLKYGQTEIINEAKVRMIFRQTNTYTTDGILLGISEHNAAFFHLEMKNVVETFFSRFEVVQ